MEMAMDDLSPSETLKPAVLIFTGNDTPLECLQPILWGLEEEGVPVSVQHVSTGTAGQRAWQAARRSPLNVGLGLDCGSRIAALHHKDLPASEPLLTISEAELKPERLRRLGANAAKLAKGDPLLLGTPFPQNGQGCLLSFQDWPRERLIALVAAIALTLVEHHRMDK